MTEHYNKCHGNFPYYYCNKFPKVYIILIHNRPEYLVS